MGHPYAHQPSSCRIYKRVTPPARERFDIGCLQRRPYQGSVAVEDLNFGGSVLLMRTRFALERPISA